MPSSLLRPGALPFVPFARSPHSGNIYASSPPEFHSYTFFASAHEEEEEDVSEGNIIGRTAHADQPVELRIVVPPPPRSQRLSPEEAYEMEVSEHGVLQEGENISTANEH